MLHKQPWSRTEIHIHCHSFIVESKVSQNSTTSLNKLNNIHKEYKIYITAGIDTKKSQVFKVLTNI